MSDFDSVWWEWYCSLFPSSEHEVVDPREWKCECGYTWHFGMISKIRMLLFGEIVHTCPNCLRKKRFHMITNIIRDISNEKDLREWNKHIGDRR
jgi:hypothetical protein